MGLELSEKIQREKIRQEMEKNQKKSQKSILKQQVESQQQEARSKAFGSLDSDMAAIMGFSSFDTQKP